MSLISRSGNISNSVVTYRHECACSNTINCPCQYKVFIPLDQNWDVDQYIKVDPDACCSFYGFEVTLCR